MKVRELSPADGVLEGVISLNDLALAAHERKDEFPSPPTYEEITLTLKSHCASALGRFSFPPKVRVGFF